MIRPSTTFTTQMIIGEWNIMSLPSFSFLWSLFPFSFIDAFISPSLTHIWNSNHHLSSSNFTYSFRTSIDGTLCNKTDIVDLFDTDHGANSLNNSWLCSQSNQAPGCRYEDELFLERVLATIEAHDPSQPFFLFWAPHIVHGSFLKSLVVLI